MREIPRVAVLALLATLAPQLGCSSGGDGCTPATEVCDGQDNDCNGVADEGCACVNDATQACFTGPPATRSVGACKDGVQTCASGQWGDCTGQVLPSVDLCGNAVDDDCDGVVDQRDDSDSACSSDLFLGNVSGDTGSDEVGHAGYLDAWYWATFTENNADAFGKELHGTVELYNSGSVDYDVEVYCMECGGHLMATSSAGPGLTDVVNFFANDDWFSNDWFNVYFHVVRRDTLAVCGDYYLLVTGNRGEGDHWSNVCDRPH